MMERDFGAEIDALKEEVRQIQKMLVRGVLPKMMARAPQEGKDVLTPTGREQLAELQSQLIAYAQDNNTTGSVAYTGMFNTRDVDGERQSFWAMTANTDDLLALNDNRLVEKVLSSVGNSQRLSILLALLKSPLTAAQLVEALGANTTGQIYHHLKPLVAADIIKEEKGTYAVIPHRVQGIIMLLAGVRDLIDTKYTSGSWEEQA